MGRKIVVIVLGGALLAALVVTLVRISGPENGSLGREGQAKREADLRIKAGQIISETNARFSNANNPPVIASFELRFEGEILRMNVGPGWSSMTRKEKSQVVEYVASRYIVFWQREMKSHGEPAIVFRNDDQRVGLHTRIDHWVR